MKQLSLLLIATLAIWGLGSCDNAKLEAMKAEQERAVDSLANAQIEELKAQLMEDCDASVEEMIQMKVDSIQAAVPSGGSSKTNTTTSKPTTTKPTPKPTTPTEVTPNTGGGRDLKDRRRGNSTSPAGAGTMTNPDGSTVTPNTGGGRDLKDRRRGRGRGRGGNNNRRRGGGN